MFIEICHVISRHAVEICHVFARREIVARFAAYNSLIRKMFGYRVFESVTEQQLSLGRPAWEQTWELLVEKIKFGFYQSLSKCIAGVFSFLHS